MNKFNVIAHLCSAVKNASHAVILTHNIDFLFIENILLPRLREIGSPQLTIFADAACASNSFQTQERLITKLGLRYRVVPVDMGSSRRFHPKALFLAGEENAALAVGSGNATHGGWSSNQEIWSDFLLPGEGGPEIASFKNYLQAILQIIPNPLQIQTDALAAFLENKNKWANILPPPGGLAWTPNSKTILNQILSLIGNNISSIDVLSPYFDPNGKALNSLAEVAQEEIKVFLQPRRAGISQDIAKELPSKVKLQTIEANTKDRQYKFIHAKTYIFHTPDGIFSASGSANCSSAALLSTEKFGNAELIALKKSNATEINELWSGFSFSDSPPTLPEFHPSEEWTIETSDLRILAARKDGVNLEIYYKSSTSTPITKLFATSSNSDSPRLEAESIDESKAVFTVESSWSSCWIIGIHTNGSEITSSPSWIDDERSLRMAGPERMLRDKLTDIAKRPNIMGGDFLEILALFDLYTQRPITMGISSNSTEPKNSSEPIYFSEEDIYSENFGTPTALFNSSYRHLTDTDETALILSFFQTNQDRKERLLPRSARSNAEAEGEGTKPHDIKQAEEQVDNTARTSKILRLLRRIEASLAQTVFVTSRPPERLAADISLLSILMIVALYKGYIESSVYTEQSLRLWKILFFGETGKKGTILTHLETLAEREKYAFISKIRSPKLTASMTLWCMIDWNNADIDAKKFRFASAELSSRYRWISEGGSEEEVMFELEQIASKLLPEENVKKFFSSGKIGFEMVILWKLFQKLLLIKTKKNSLLFARVQKFLQEN